MDILGTYFHVGPVTALQFITENIAIAGVGSDLFVYDVDSNLDLTHHKAALHGARIHIIHACPVASETDKHQLCVAGSKCARIMTFDLVTHTLQPITDQAQFSDWILAAHWLRDEGMSTIALALAHNVVVLWECAVNQVRRRVCCEENCLLYIAHFMGDTWANLELAAGTVFNQVVIWTVSRSADGGTNVQHRLTGHSGVIFGLDYNRTIHTLCSVSDDRSVRIWRHTDEAIPTYQCDHVLYGHSARVWAVKVTTRNIVTVGEDAVCCVWDYKGHLTQKFKGHKGKNIWSVAVSPNQQKVVTGGGDGGIRVCTINDDVTASRAQDENLAKIIPPLTKDDSVRSVCLPDYNTLYLMTNTGRLIHYDLQTSIITTVMCDPEFHSYAIMSANESKMVAMESKMVAVGSMGGRLRIFLDIDGGKFSSCERQAYSGKTLSIVWLSCTSLLTCGPDGQIRGIKRLFEPNLIYRQDVWDINVRDATISLTPHHTYLLPYCRQRWVTTTTITQCRLLICGTKGGTIHVYDLSLPDPIQTFPKIHGKSGVTHICCHDNHIYSCGRDGHYRKYRIVSNRLELLNAVRVMKGMDWVQSLHFVNDQLLVHGFNGSQFVIYNVDEGSRLVDISCGGGHRSWGCGVHGDSVILVYVKMCDVWRCDVKVKTSQTTLKEGLHGRQISSIRYLKTSNSNSVDVLLTGSEDTSMNLLQLEYTTTGPTLTTLQNIRGHISNIKCLATVDKGQGQTLVFSAGGRAQVMVWLISLGEPEFGGDNDDDDVVKEHSINSDSYQTYDSNNLKTNYVSDLGSNHTSDHTICANNDSSTYPIDNYVSNDYSDQTHVFPQENRPCPANIAVHTNIPDVQYNHENVCQNCSVSDNKYDNLIQTTYKNKGKCSVNIGEKESCKSKMSKDTSDSVRLKQCEIDESKLNIDVKSCDNNDDEILMCTKTDELKKMKKDPTLHRPVKKLESSYEMLGTYFMTENKSRKHKPWRRKAAFELPETRFMDITCIQGSDVSKELGRGVYVVAAGCSDGVVRVFTYNETHHNLTLIAHTNFHNHCVLKVGHFVCGSSTFLYSAATDGRISLWDMTAIVTIYMSKQLASDCGDGENDRNKEDTRTYDVDKKSEFCTMLTTVNKKRTNVKGAMLTTLNDKYTNAKQHRSVNCDGELLCSRDKFVTEIPEPDEMLCRSKGKLSNFHHDLATDLAEVSYSKNIEVEQNNDEKITLKEEIQYSRHKSATNIEVSNLDSVNSEESTLKTHSKNCVESGLNRLSIDNETKISDLDFEDIESEDENDNTTVTKEAEIYQSRSRNVEVGQGCVEMGQPALVIRSHQSGVNAVDVFNLSERRLMLASGGDDNALRISYINVDDNGRLRFDRELTRADAHAAQICGVKILRGDLVVTSSLDQRVCVWRLLPDRIEMVACKLCSTADISSMEVWPNGEGYKIAVCGDGIDVFTLSSPS